MRETARKYSSPILPAIALFGCIVNAAPANRGGRIVLPPELTFPARFVAPSWPKESVRAELARLQEQTGLSLVLVENSKIQFVNFGRRTLSKVRDLPSGGMGAISPDGTEIAFSIFRGVLPTYLGVSRTDGTGLREYPYLEMPNQICWSHDNSILAMRAKDRRNDGPYGLLTMNVETQTTQAVDRGGSPTPQCWSPNAKQLVYEAEGNVEVYDANGSKSQVVSKGTQPTWSPDRSWIAFLDHDTYYAIRPSGAEKRELFHKKGASSGLWWSQDSRIVAYVSQAGLLEGGFSLDVESYWLRVRRLGDGSEDKLVGSGGGSSYQWVTNPQLLEQVREANTSK